MYFYLTFNITLFLMKLLVPSNLAIPARFNLDRRDLTLFNTAID